MGSNPASPTILVMSHKVVGGQVDCARNQGITMRLGKTSSWVILALSCSLLSLFVVPSVSAEAPSKSPLIVAAQFTPDGSRRSGGQGYAVAKGLRVTLADSPSRSGNDRVEIARMINRPGSNKLMMVQKCEIGPEANACVIANPNRHAYKSGVLKARFIKNGRYGPWNKGIPVVDWPYLLYPYLPDGTKLEQVGATSSGPSLVSSKTFEEIILADEGIVSENWSKFTKPTTLDTLLFAGVVPLVRGSYDSIAADLDPTTCVGIDSNKNDSVARATSTCLRFSFKDALAIVYARSARSSCFGKPHCLFLYLESGEIAELTRGVPDDLQARLTIGFVAAEPGAIFLQVYLQPDDGNMVGGGVACMMVRVSLSNGIPECVPYGRVSATYSRSGPENSYVVAESKFFNPEDRERLAAEPEMVQFHTWKNGIFTAVGPVVEVFNRIVGTGSQQYFDFFLESSGNLIVTDTSMPETSLRWTRVTRTVKYALEPGRYKDTWYEAKSFVRLRMIKPDGAVRDLGAIPVLFIKACLVCDVDRPSVRFLGSFADGKTYLQVTIGSSLRLFNTWFSANGASGAAAISLHRIDTNSGLVEAVSTSPIKALEFAYGSVDGPGTWDDEAPEGLLGWRMINPSMTVNVGGLTFGLYGKTNVSPRVNRGKYGGYLAQYLPELRPLLTSVVDARWIGAAGKYLLVYGLDSGGQPILSSIDSATMLEKVVARGPQTRIGKSWGRDWLTFFDVSSEVFCGCLVRGTFDPAILPLADNRFTLVGVNHDRTRFSITELVVPG